MHGEHHRSGRVGWLRAAVLGADDGIVSVASLMVGVAAASGSRGAVLLAGVAGLVAGAMSMGAGEYVSVSSQRDTEKADIAREMEEIASNPEGELLELARIYQKRGLDRELSLKVAEQLMAADPLTSHARDELGYEEASSARPLQAAVVSASSFAFAALIPILALLALPESARIAGIVVAALVGLGIFGALGGHLGAAPKGRAALRVLIGGGLSMGITAAVGRLLGGGAP